MGAKIIIEASDHTARRHRVIVMAESFGDILRDLTAAEQSHGSFRPFARVDAPALAAMLYGQETTRPVQSSDFRAASAAYVDDVDFGSDDTDPVQHAPVKATIVEPAQPVPSLETVATTIRTGSLTISQLKRLRRELALQCHPDRSSSHRHSGSTLLMRDVNALIDEALRTARSIIN